METLVQPLIKAFGWSIVNSLWQSALIYGVLFLLLFSLPKLAAKFKHNLAFGSILLMFGCFVYNFCSQLLKYIPNENVLTSTATSGLYPYLEKVPQSLSNKIEQYFPVVFIFYIIGIVLQMFIIGKGYHQLSILKKNNVSNIPEVWKTIFESVTSKLKINKAIKFHLSDLVNVPLVIGYLKPVVLFPVALINQLDNDQVEAILIHELSHIRRNDFLLNLIKTAIETLLFYNPFVWMAGRFIHIEREHACDDLVLKVTGKPLNYAHALLKLELLKDKTSPAYALAATGKTQNLYQRIKRITNMKTNYLNAKQQMAAFTLGVACLFSIAWINPAEKKENKISNQHVVQLKAVKNGNTVVYMDTTKRRKVKIVTIDANGNKKEYNSIKEMPDSLRKDFYRDELFGGRNAFIIKSDSGFKFGDSLFQAKIYRQFNSPEAQLRWKKFGEDVASEYSSPEAQAKWKKFGEDIAKEYGSPEAQAKWKKIGEDIAKEYGSPEAQAKWKKLGEEMASKINTPEFRAQISELRTKTLKNGEKIRISALSRLNSDTAYVLHNDNFRTMKNRDGVYLIENSSKLKQSEEYKKLKQKFEMEVKELKEKMEKQEKKEQPERTEKSGQ